MDVENQIKKEKRLQQAGKAKKTFKDLVCTEQGRRENAANKNLL